MRGVHGRFGGALGSLWLDKHKHLNLGLRFCGSVMLWSELCPSKVVGALTLNMQVLGDGALGS